MKHLDYEEENYEEYSIRDQVDEYKTLEEKDNFFELNQAIETIADAKNLLDLLHTMKKKGGLIFRGHKRAKYKIWSTAHRDRCNTNSFYYFTKYVEEKIKNYRSLEEGKIQRHLSMMNIEINNDLSLLSYAQHYGFPTPFIDFSRNPFVALFFAMEVSSSLTNQTKIEKYASLYFVNPEWYAFEGQSKLFKDFITQKDGTLRLSYANFNTPPYFIINDQIPEFKLHNNQNIINQEGLFYCYNWSGKSLEAQFKQDAKFASTSGRLPSEREYKLCACWNINIKLKEFILGQLNKMGINDEFIYPLKYQK